MKIDHVLSLHIFITTITDRNPELLKSMLRFFLLTLVLGGIISCADDPTVTEPNGTKVVFRMQAGVKYDSILCGVLYMPRSGPDAIVTPSTKLVSDGDSMLFELGDVEYFTPICMGYLPALVGIDLLVHDDNRLPEKVIGKYVYEIRTDTILRWTE